MERIKKLNEIGHLLVRLHKLRSEIDDLKHNQTVLKNRIGPLMPTAHKLKDLA